MKRSTKATLAFRREGIQLSQREMQALRSASRIASKARDLARLMDADFEHSHFDTWLAEIEHNIDDFADGFIPVTEQVRI